MDSFTTRKKPFSLYFLSRFTKRKPNSVEMKVVTWHKESHGLFDYEASQIDVQRIQTDRSANVFREGSVLI